MPLRARRLLLLLLLLAAALRLVGLNNGSPPGLEHDEVANWLIDRSILAGNHAVYFTAAYGHEAGFHYVQAASVALLGDHALALRLPAAFAGLLLVAASFALARRLFGWQTALIATAFLAVLFWPVFYSRLGLRAISLPLLSALSAYAWWRAWPPGTTPTPQRLANRWFALAGALAGLSLYTYMAARIVPIFYGFFLLYLAIFHRPGLRQHWRGVLLFWLVMLVVATPLGHYLLTNPAAEFRLSEIDAPLQALRQGDLQPVLANSLRILGMFGLRGDPLWRQNVAPRPVYDPITALLFYLCILLCIIRVRDIRYSFLILWTFTAFIPSILSKDAPSSIRIINILPVLTLLPAIVIHNSYRLSTEKVTLSTGNRLRWGITLLTLALVLFHLGRTVVWLSTTWPANEEVQFVWQEALTAAAGYLDSTPESGPAAIGGWTPDTMDPPTMALTLRRQDLALRFFDPRDAVILPAGTNARLLHPTILPLAPLLAEQLATWGIQPVVQGSFTRYAVPQPPDVRPPFPAGESGVTFGDELRFLGFALAPNCTSAAEDDCQVITYWQVLAPAGEPRRIFLHVLDDANNIVTQDDRLNVPAAYWQPGDLILQQHTLDIPSLAPYTLRLGVYNPSRPGSPPLATEDGTGYLLLP